MVGLMLHCNLFAANGGYAATVSVSKVKIQDVIESVAVVGKLEAVKDPWIDVEIAGLVSSQKYQRGQWVKKGDLLLQLNEATVQLKLKSAISLLKEQQNSYKLSQKLLNRSRLLLKDGHVTKESVEIDETNHAILILKIEGLQENINLLKHQIKQHKLYAPFDGLISKGESVHGKWVQPGQGVLQILKLDEMVAEFEFPEIRLSQLDKSSVLNLGIDALPKIKIKASLNSILPGEKVGNRMLLLRYYFKNTSESLLPGMSVHANIQMQVLKNAILVPKDSIVMQGPMTFVYTADEKNIANKVMVEILRYYKSYAVVKGKLKSDDLIVTRGNEFLQPGIPLKIVDPSSK